LLFSAGSGLRGQQKWGESPRTQRESPKENGKMFVLRSGIVLAGAGAADKK
jgi:hypothetical protein